MAIAIRIPALWIIPQEAVISKPGMLASLVAWINAMPVLSVVVSLLMVVSLAFMINEMVRSHAMMRPVGYLPAYFFILLQSIYSSCANMAKCHLVRQHLKNVWPNATLPKSCKPRGFRPNVIGPNAIAPRKHSFKLLNRNHFFFVL